MRMLNCYLFPLAIEQPFVNQQRWKRYHASRNNPTSDRKPHVYTHTITILFQWWAGYIGLRPYAHWMWYLAVSVCCLSVQIVGPLPHQDFTIACA